MAQSECLPTCFNYRIVRYLNYIAFERPCQRKSARVLAGRQVPSVASSLGRARAGPPCCQCAPSPRALSGSWPAQSLGGARDPARAGAGDPESLDAARDPCPEAVAGDPEPVEGPVERPVGSRTPFTQCRSDRETTQYPLATLDSPLQEDPRHHPLPSALPARTAGDPSHALSTFGAQARCVKTRRATARVAVMRPTGRRTPVERFPPPTVYGQGCVRATPLSRGGSQDWASPGWRIQGYWVAAQHRLL